MLTSHEYANARTSTHTLFLISNIRALPCPTDQGDDCEEQWMDVSCEDGNLIVGQDCDETCEYCDDYTDYTDITGGQYTCDDNYYYNNSKAEQLPGCFYQSCDGEFGAKRASRGRRWEGLAGGSSRSARAIVVCGRRVGDQADMVCDRSARSRLRRTSSPPRMRSFISPLLPPFELPYSRTSSD